MNAMNQKNVKFAGGRGMKLLKKQGLRKMSNREYARYIFWIVLTVILLSTIAGS